MNNLLTRKWAEEITSTEFTDEAWEDIAELLKAAYEEVKRELEGIIDKYMANGNYVVESEGVKIRGTSGDFEQVWKNIKLELQEYWKDKEVE